MTTLQDGSHPEDASAIAKRPPSPRLRHGGQVLARSYLHDMAGTTLREVGLLETAEALITVLWPAKSDRLQP